MDLVNQLRAIVGQKNVHLGDEIRTDFGADQTENPAQSPSVVISATHVEQIQDLVKLAGQNKIPITPRVAGTNLGGLTIPEKDGWGLDLSKMNRIIDINHQDMVALIEPGVTFGQLKEALDRCDPPLTIGFPLSPPHTSVAANCLLDGLGNLSLRHGAMGEWISGLEVVRADGSLARTGAWALGVDIPFGRAPFPDLTGLFVSWQGSTGIVSKLAVQLWPLMPYRERAFILSYDRRATMKALCDLPNMDILHDLGSLSWPTGKMLFGVDNPMERDPAEPEFFLYVDITGASQELLDAKKRALSSYLAGLRTQGYRIEDPIDINALVALEPRLGKLAEFPTRLDFLLDHPSGGLTWVGTYGPMSRFERGTDRGIEIIERHGFPPMIVARPMKGGHFGVLRFIEVFQRDDPEQCKRVLACNQEICDALREDGFVMYKTPSWAVERYREHLDPGFCRLVREVRGLLDPDGIMNPGRWNLGEA